MAPPEKQDGAMDGGRRDLASRVFDVLSGLTAADDGHNRYQAKGGSSDNGPNPDWHVGTPLG